MLRILWLPLLIVYLLGFVFVWGGTLAGFAWAGPPQWSAAKRIIFATERAALWPVLMPLSILGIKLSLPLPLPHSFVPDLDTTPPGPPKPIRPVPDSNPATKG
jgi:hypothetical protein